MNRNRRKPLGLLTLTFGTAILISTLQPQPARADDAALYGPEAPPNSAFVRVVNASANGDLDARVGDKAVDRLGAWSVSEFEYLPAGTQTIVAGSQTESAQLQAGHFYTAVADGQSLRLLENAGYENRLKALVILYNLTDQNDLSLRTTDGKTTLVEPVERENSGAREVNAARAKLALFAGDTRIADTQPLTLNRGKALSLFAIGPASSPKLVYATN